MAEPSQRKLSVSTLVYSTLGPSLGLLPSEKKHDWVADTEKDNEKEAIAVSNVHSEESIATRPRPQRMSADRVDEIHQHQDLRRLYSSPASSYGKNSRLSFQSKSGAGSISSMEQATISKQASVNEDVTEVPVSKQLQSQISPRSSVGEPNPSTPRSPKNSGLGLIPRAPTGSEWSRSKKDNKDTNSSNSVGLSEMLQDLDKEAGEKQHRNRVQSLQRDSKIGKPISWEEDAISNRHLWEAVDTREACHLADTQYCQQLKLFNPKRQKLKCAACKALVHETCVKQLYYEGYCCKETFREIKQKVKETATYHHFLQRRKASGRCLKCERGFGNWRKFNLRDIVGVSCSWCGDSYHVGCFNESMRRQPCHMGPLRNLIIPPSWIVKVPYSEPVTSSFASSSGTLDTHRGSSRRKTRRSRRKKVDERASKYFTVKPIASRQHKPLLVFINPKSGGNQGARLLQTFKWLLNPRQVFDLSQGGPEFGLKMYQGVNNIRILACGGDGTCGWIFSELDKLDIRPSPPLAILPLGTGNDLARVFGWGGGYTDEPIEKILLHVDEGPVEEMDRWHLKIWENPHGQRDSEGAVDDIHLHVVNNYFSIGADAQVTLQFHLGREANPERFNSRARNKFQYSLLGGKDLFLRKFSTLTDHIKIYADGEDLTEKVRSLKLEAICFLNIPSYGSGANAWGNPSPRDRLFRPQLMDDGKIEIVGFWASTFPRLMVGLTHGERIAHCEHIKLVMEKAFPIQIDGEAWKLQPSVIEVGLKNRANLVRKVPRVHPNAPLQGVRPSDRIKLSVSKVTSDQYDRLHSDLFEIRKIAKALGLVVATSQCTLQNVRVQIEHFTEETDEDGESHLSKNWRYLDVANSGRVDRMFQVTPDQEKTMLIGDMLSDGLLIVELPPSPASTPSVESHPSILLSPGDNPETSLDTAASEKRKMFGRNSSYECAAENQMSLKGMSPPPINGIANKDGLEVPTNPNLVVDSSSPSDTPIPSDEESPLLNMGDPGSDSNATEDGSSIQKKLLDSVKRGNLKKVKDFHSKGANLTEADQNGWTLLHHAARLDKVEVVQYIVKNIPKEGLDLVENEKIQTALHKAAWYGHLEVCKVLVEEGASLLRRDYQGNDIFDKAVQSANKELQAYIKEKKKKQDLNSDEVAI